MRGHGAVDAGVTVIQHRPEDDLDTTVLDVTLNHLWFGA